MHYIKRSNEEVNERCRFLKSLGFVIEHDDICVSMGEMVFDFSAARMDVEAIIQIVAETSRKGGIEEGKKEIQSEMKRLLGL